MLTIDDVRERVPVSRRTIYALIKREGFPPGRKVPGRGNRVFFEPNAVAAWVQANGWGARS